MSGRVYLVGAGPGDPGLLTLRGARCLAAADVVLVDSLVDPRILRHARPEAAVVDVGKRGDAGRRDAEQADINRRLVEEAKAGRTVVRLKGGDPFLFGRGGEEAAVLAAAGIAFEVVPGVTSAVAVPAYAGIPVTHRGVASGVAVVTGHGAADGDTALDWAALARLETLVFLMARSRLGEIVARVAAAGRDPATPCALIHRGTTTGQRVVVAPLGEIAGAVDAAGVGTPSLLVVGEVVRERERLAWFERRPLLGRRILVTRPLEQAAGFVDRLEDLGAEAVEAAAIEIAELEPSAELARALAEIESFAWIVFTSRNGVRGFFARLRAAGRDARALGRARLAAIGPATAEALESHGLGADLVPEAHVAEALAERLVPEVAGKRVLLPRAAGARDVLPRSLAAAGAAVTDLPLYRAVRAPSLPERARRLLRDGAIDAVAFTSSSTVRSFLELLGGEERRLLDGVAVASIGPVTSATAREMGLAVAIEARRHSTAGLLEALVDTLGPGR